MQENVKIKFKEKIRQFALEIFYSFYFRFSTDAYKSGGALGDQILGETTHWLPIIKFTVRKKLLSRDKNLQNKRVFFQVWQ